MLSPGLIDVKRGPYSMVISDKLEFRHVSPRLIIFDRKLTKTINVTIWILTNRLQV